MRKILLPLIVANLLFAESLYYMNNGKKVYLQPVEKRAATRSLARERRFKEPSGAEIVVSKRLLVKFEAGADVQKYLQRFRLKLLKKYRLGNLYLLEASSPEAAIEAADALYVLPDVIVAQPDIAKKRQLR
ncbi:hypothetical protein [Hydrogenimonas sp. SS33]|uniref:hypothetical protein n=1 Tax=Hydrogenimonas leucolamina TaxID=2954236 RepID=UPI00336C1EDE